MGVLHLLVIATHVTVDTVSTEKFLRGATTFSFDMKSFQLSKENVSHVINVNDNNIKRPNQWVIYYFMSFIVIPDIK